MNKTVLAHLALFAANLIYGANYTIAKEVMPDFVLPFGFILIRVLGALILFWSFSFFMNLEKIDKRDLPIFILAGFFGVALNQMMFFKGLNITTPINASIMMITTPILVLVIASIALRERVTLLKLVGIILGFSGAVILLLVKGDLSFGSKYLMGNLFVFINATSYGIYLVIIKPLMQKYQPFTVIRWVFLFGFCFVLPFGYEQFSQVDWQNMPTEIYAAIAYVVVGTTFFAYSFNVIALKQLSPSVVSSYIYLQPILASFIAIAYGKDELNIVKVVSTVLIFIGVYLVSQPLKAKE